MKDGVLPKVSVLVAARNEAAHIRECLEALIRQDYDPARFEIWVGDDQSTDETGTIVAAYALQHTNIRLLRIENNIGHQQGKSNVLAHLAHRASGEYLLITDADMTVVPTWINTMLAYFSPEVGVITGVTAVVGRSLFARLQNAEWLFYTAHGHFHAQKGKPVTAMGNNMAVRTSAYWQTGGYENIPFSVTEDYELFRQILKKGFQFRSVFEKGALGFTHPLPSFGALVRQRRRWFTGAFQLPKFFVSGLVLLWAFLPVLLFVGYFAGWWVAGTLFLLKWLTDCWFLVKSYRELGLRADAGIWLYTPCSAICNTIFLVLQLVPGPVEWKGRKYTQDHAGIGLSGNSPSAF